MATFFLINCSNFFFKINRVEATHEMDKLWKFHKNATKKVDFIAKTRKRLNRRMEGQTDGQWKPCHDISSAGFQGVEL